MISSEVGTARKQVAALRGRESESIDELNDFAAHAERQANSSSSFSSGLRKKRGGLRYDSPPR